MARSARREVISLLIDRQLPFTEAEVLLSRDRETRLRDLRGKVAAAGQLLEALVADVDDLRVGSGDDDGELADTVATTAAACESFLGSGGVRFERDRAAAPLPYDR